MKIYEKDFPRGVHLAFRSLAWSLRPLVNAILSKSWEGKANLPTDRGFIVCPNHVTEIDPVVVGHMLYNAGHPPHFLAKTSLFRIPIFGRLITAAKQIPVDRRGSGAGRALVVARRVLKDNGAIVIYPEGTLTRDPELWPMVGKTGAARLALRTGAPVVPVAHWGTQEAFGRYDKRVHLFPRRHVRVLVGEPLDLSDYRDRHPSKEVLAEVTELIMAAITELLEQLRNEKAPQRRWNPEDHGQRAVGRDFEGPETPSLESESTQSPRAEDDL